MSTVYVDSALPEPLVRQKLYAGDIFMHSPSPGVLALCDFTRSLAEQAFGRVHPTVAQYHLAPDKYAQILGRLKPLLSTIRTPGYSFVTF